MSSSSSTSLVDCQSPTAASDVIVEASAVTSSSPKNETKTQQPKKNEESSSDDEPLEIVDFTRVGLFENCIHDLVKFILEKYKEFEANQKDKQTSSKSFSFSLELPEALQGIHDFDQALHGNTNSNSNRHHNNSNEQEEYSLSIVATLNLFTSSTTSASNTNNNNNNNINPIQGLCGIPSYLFIRPKQRVANVSPQLTSSLLSLGTCALDEVNSRLSSGNSTNKDLIGKLLNVPIFAPCGNRFTMAYKGVSSFHHLAARNNNNKTAAEYVLATSSCSETAKTNLLPIVLQQENESSSASSRIISTETSTKQISFAQPENRALTGLGTLDGLVDLFVHTSIGHSARFIRVKEDQINGTTHQHSSNSSPSTTSSNQQSQQKSGTVWADVSRVYRSAVPHKQRWNDAVLASWSSHPNGHDRAVAGLMLGFDDPHWARHLAGCPALPMGTTENPIESFSIEFSWDYLSVEATSITDNESSSWFEDVIHGLFVNSLKNHYSKSGSKASSNQNAFRVNPVATAAIASLGPPNSVQISSHLRHHGEISSKVSSSFGKFVRESAKVLAVQLDNSRRRYLVEKEKQKLGASGGNIRNAVSNAISGNSPVYDGDNNTEDMNSDYSVNGSPNRSSNNNNNNTRNQQQQPSGSEAIKSAVSSWVSALWSAGTSAATAVAHTATDALKRAHPEELIIPRRSLIAGHINNVLAALRRPDHGREGFVVAKPSPGLYTNGIRPNDLRRQIPPGSIMSRFACECANLKHADAVKQFFFTLIDVLKEVLTASKGREDMEEEYASVNALQLIEDGENVATLKRKNNAAASSSGSSSSTYPAHIKRDTKKLQSERQEDAAMRAEILLSCLLVDFEEEGVDCVADIFHQKFQALALCATAIKNGHVAGRKAADPILIESPRRLHHLHQKSTKNENDNEDEEPIFAPADRRFVCPLTYGERDEEHNNNNNSESGTSPSTTPRTTTPTTASANKNENLSSNESGHASRILLRDMSDFLRVNAKRKKSVCLADFLAWFSPADILKDRRRFGKNEDDDDDAQKQERQHVDPQEENLFNFTEQQQQEAQNEEDHAKQIGSLPLGYLYLSSRMKARGNAWRESWHIASKMHSALALASENDYQDELARSSSSNFFTKSNDDEPLQEALEIFKWFKERSEREIMYVVLKGQVAACTAQMVQHPVFSTLIAHGHSTKQNSSSNVSPLAKITAATISKISHTFPSWSDFDDTLQIYVDDDDEEDTNSTENGSTKSPSATASSPPIFDSVSPEIQHNLNQLFADVSHELEKAEYLLCTAIGICDAVSPFGSSDTDDLLHFTHNLVVSAFKHVAKTDPRFVHHTNPTNNGSNHLSTVIAESELPSSWTSTITAGDITNRISDPVFLDPNLFFFGSRSSSSPSLCVAWLNAERGSSSELDSIFRGDEKTASKFHHQAKVKKELLRKYRVYGYTEQIVANSTNSLVSLPATFQRIVVLVEKSTKQVTMSSFNSKVF